jgi:vacuolar-type H+-ATPase subunit I/STV1
MSKKELIQEKLSEIERLKEEIEELKKEDEKYFDLEKLDIQQGVSNIFDKDKSKKAGFDDNSFIQFRDFGEYKNKAFYLDDDSYNWELKKDSENMLCLIPTKKQ